MGGQTERESVHHAVDDDAGNVYASDDDISLSELRMSTGISGVWMSPFGMISVSYAQPFKDQRGDEIQKFQFNFGTQF